jgi:competence protein ComEA
MQADESDPFAKLDPSSRRAPKTARVAVGAAIVCFLVAVAVAALLSAAGGGDQGVLSTGDEVPVSTEGAPGGHGAAPSANDRAALLVHVLGAVVRPGLVELAADARVIDAVSAAGGLTGDADVSGVNLARPVADGEQLVVPVVGQLPPPGAAAGPGSNAGGASPPGAASDGLIHLNSAGLAELDSLPRIGPALAQRILDWRDANGPFTGVEQLREVAGIGDATFAGLVDLVAL